MNSIDKNLSFCSETLNFLMIEQGLDSANLSREIHKFEGNSSARISARNIQRWRNGLVEPSLGFTKRLADYFSRPVLDFYITVDTTERNKEFELFSEFRYQYLVDMVLEEGAASLNQVDFFDGKTFKAILRDILNMPTFRGYTAEDVVSEISIKRSDSALLGLYDQETLSRSTFRLRINPIQVSLPVTMIGAICIFEYMIKYMHLRFKIDFTCCTGPDVVHSIKSGSSEIGILPPGTAADSIGKTKGLKYSPTMMMPGGSFAIIGNQKTDPVKPDVFMVVTERPSSATTYLDQLKQLGTISSDIQYVHTEQSDSLKIMKASTEKISSAHWFPAYNFAAFQGVQTGLRSTPKDSVRHSLMTYLFTREDLFDGIAEKDLLTRLVRHTWLTLTEHPEILNEIILDLCERNNHQFLRSLLRCSGFLSAKLV